jgi:hypothetical protein
MYKDQTNADIKTPNCIYEYASLLLCPHSSAVCYCRRCTYVNERHSPVATTATFTSISTLTCCCRRCAAGAAANGGETLLSSHTPPRSGRGRMESHSTRQTLQQKYAVLASRCHPTSRNQNSDWKQRWHCTVATESSSTDFPPPSLLRFPSNAFRPCIPLQSSTHSVHTMFAVITTW